MSFPGTKLHSLETGANEDELTAGVFAVFGAVLEDGSIRVPIAGVDGAEDVASEAVRTSATVSSRSIDAQKKRMSRGESRKGTIVSVVATDGEAAEGRPELGAHGVEAALGRSRVGDLNEQEVGSKEGAVRGVAGLRRVEVGTDVRTGVRDARRRP